MNKSKTILLTSIVGLLLSASAQAETLSLDTFLQQVRGEHQGFKAATESSEGAALRSSDASLPLSPALFGNAVFTTDASTALGSTLSYDRMNSHSYQLGLSQQFAFGLNTKLSYSLLYYSLENPSIAIPPGYTSKPVLELSMPLWGNGFGRSVRAARDAAEAQALATSYGSRFQAHATLVDAEVTYWRLALARESVQVQSNALERAKKMFEWNTRRANLQLADQSDALQSEALYRIRQLDLEQAQDDEKTASKLFNSARNINSDTVGESLAPLDQGMIDKLQPPTRAAQRDDVKAAEQASRASIAASQLTREKDSPTLDLFGSAALNGRNSELSSALSDPFSAHKPTNTIGVRLNLPLDFGTIADARRGAAREQLSAELNYQRKQFEQETSWKELSDRFEQSRHRLQLARAIESTQEAKLKRERERLQSGRSTTFQVLQFEQDYELSQLSRMRAQIEVLTLVAQMKLFGETL